MTEKLRFLALCWRAYNGDIGAALEVARILRGKVRDLRS